MKKYFLCPFTASLLIALLPFSALSQNQYYYNPANQSAWHHPLVRGWMGVELVPVPAALRSQLKSFILAGQGLMVNHIERYSPAASAGITNYDILLTLDEQKLYSPAQLSGLINSIEPGKQVSLQLVRAAGIKTLTLEITSRQVQPMHRPPFNFRKPYPAMPKPSSWDSFETLQVNTLGNGRYHAEVTFKNHSNETKSFVFEGKKEEIVQQIQQQPDLPIDKKTALLDALNMRKDNFSRPFNTPFFQHNPFNDPFFQHDFFSEPFFRHPFFQQYPG